MFGDLLQVNRPSPVTTIESKRLRDTVRTISRQWVPAHPMLQSRFEKLCLRQNVDRAELMHVLMQDPGLCIYVLRSLHRIFPEKNKIALRTAFAEIELDQLARLVSVPAAEISGKAYDSASRHQTSELRQSVFMTAAASVLADRAEVDAGKARWVAFSRELGFLLVAWSYPHLYNRAMSRRRAANSTLSEELTRLIGVSPEALGKYLLSEWRLIFAEGDPEASSSDGKIAIEELVDLAELWGRSHDEHYFGSAVEQWQKAGPVLREALGTDLLSALQSSSDKAFEAHKAYLPLATKAEVKSKLSISQKSVPRAAGDSAEVVSRNVARLPDMYQPLFADAYAHLEYPETARDGLRTVVQSIVPILGFQRGCLFVLSRDGNRMLPALRFGELPLNRYDEYRFDRYQGMKSLIFQSVPFKRNGIGFAGTEVTYICGGLDSPTHQGVLYLEMPEQTELNTDDSSAALLYFRCIREALNNAFDTLLE